MDTAQRLQLAYTLLPPPLSALPAKYWTSISLWLHSYIVGRTFQEFTKIYSEVKEVDAPDESEAFLIGFLHDLGQKLKLRGKPSEERLVSWTKDTLRGLGYSKGEADELARYLYTNPAEALCDPLYDRSIWRLLWLADRLQGIDNPLAIPQLLVEAKDDLGLRLNVILFNIAIPQPFLRTLLSRKVHEKLEWIAQDEGKLLIPITTPYGLAVITEEPSLTIEVNWDEIRRGFDGNGILDEKTEEDLEWNMKCCQKDDCKKTCSSRNKNRPQECKDHRMSPDSCNKAVYIGRRISTYEFTLIYYGSRKRVQKTVILPNAISPMMQNIRLTGINYDRGKGVCPICGVRTPSGVMADNLQFYNNIATEQWTRRVFPGNLNTQIMRDPSKYPVDPLCLGEAILRGKTGSRLLTSITLRALTPLPVLEEVGKLTWYLLYRLGTGIPRMIDVSNLLYNEDTFEETIVDIAKEVSIVSSPKFFYDAFTAKIVVPYRNLMQSRQDEWIRDIIVSGALVAWGLYPLTISETVPSAPSNALLSYYKGRRQLFDYQPSNKRLGEYTSYVATVMMSLAELNYKANSGENLPALLEVLDYPPEYSPLLLQYASPKFYSRLESLRRKVGVGM